MSLRVVLDNNVVLSALLFTEGKMAWIRRGWQHGLLRPVVCRETTQELLRVLAYPKFRLSHEEQQILLGDFLPFCDVSTLPTPWPSLPKCRDEKDQVFLVLTHVIRADALITGDKDLLVMNELFDRPIMTPDALLNSL